MRAGRLVCVTWAARWQGVWGTRVSQHVLESRILDKAAEHGDGRLPACVGVGLGLQLFCIVLAGALRDGFQERAVTKCT
jgi:hypothetical protein